MEDLLEQFNQTAVVAAAAASTDAVQVSGGLHPPSLSVCLLLAAAAGSSRAFVQSSRVSRIEGAARTCGRGPAGRLGHCVQLRDVLVCRRV